MNRRNLLQAVGGATAFGAFTGVSSAHGGGQQTHELCINAGNDRDYFYQFAVSGTLEKRGQPEHAPISAQHVTVDAEDDIDGTGCRVHGIVRGGFDCYQFTGDLLAFSVPEQWAHKYTIYVNGHERSASELQTAQDPSAVTCGQDSKSESSAETVEVGGNGEFCRFDNSIQFLSHSDRHKFKFATTDGIEKSNGQRVKSVTGKRRNGYKYAGEISSFAMYGRGRVHIRQGKVCSDEEVTAGKSAVGGGGEGFCEFNQRLFAQTEEGETATIKFGASHNIELSEGGRRVPAVKFTVPENDDKSFAYAGWISSMAIDGKVEVNISQKAPCADEHNQ